MARPKLTSRHLSDPAVAQLDRDFRAMRRERNDFKKQLSEIETDLGEFDLMGPEDLLGELDDEPLEEGAPMGEALGSLAGGVLAAMAERLFPAQASVLQGVGGFALAMLGDSNEVRQTGHGILAAWAYSRAAGARVASSSSAPTSDVIEADEDQPERPEPAPKKRKAKAAA